MKRYKKIVFMSIFCKPKYLFYISKILGTSEKYILQVTSFVEISIKLTLDFHLLFVEMSLMNINFCQCPNHLQMAISFWCIRYTNTKSISYKNFFITYTSKPSNLHQTKYNVSLVYFLWEGLHLLLIPSAKFCYRDKLNYK